MPRHKYQNSGPKRKAYSLPPRQMYSQAQKIKINNNRHNVKLNPNTKSNLDLKVFLNSKKKEPPHKYSFGADLNQKKYKVQNNTKSNPNLGSNRKIIASLVFQFQNNHQDISEIKQSNEKHHQKQTNRQASNLLKFPTLQKKNSTRIDLSANQIQRIQQKISRKQRMLYEPNGCGKSAFLQKIMLRKKVSRKIEFNDSDMRQYSKSLSKSNSKSKTKSHLSIVDQSMFSFWRQKQKKLKERQKKAKLVKNKNIITQFNAKEDDQDQLQWQLTPQIYVSHIYY